MILGHHVMFGKVMNLEKPIVMLKKNVQIRNVQLNDDLEIGEKMNTDEETHETQRSTEYLIQAICRKKILFNKRPKPIVYELKKEPN